MHRCPEFEIEMRRLRFKPGLECNDGPSKSKVITNRPSRTLCEILVVMLVKTAGCMYDDLQGFVTKLPKIYKVDRTKQMHRGIDWQTRPIFI